MFKHIIYKYHYKCKILFLSPHFAPAEVSVAAGSMHAECLQLYHCIQFTHPCILPSSTTASHALRAVGACPSCPSGQATSGFPCVSIGLICGVGEQ